MAKVPTDRIAKSSKELSDFTSSQAVIDSLEKAAKDKKLLRQAKADAKTFFENEGIKIPASAEATIVQRRVALSGQINICVQVCRQVGSYYVCVQVCTTIVVQNSQDVAVLG